jgi:excisionase family DNA binding protein
MSHTEPMTTGQAAKHCHVSQATVVNWIKGGKLRAYATPGGHHRILRADLLSFLEIYDMPVDASLRTSYRPRALVVSDSPNAGRLVQALQSQEHLDLAQAGNDYEAGVQVARFQPDIVVLDTTSPTLDSLSLCRWLRASPEGEAIAVLAVGDPESEEAARGAGADAGTGLEAGLEAVLTGVKE